MRTLLAVLFALLLVPETSFAQGADADYRAGMAYKSEGKTDEAIASFEKAVAAKPGHAMAWNSLGILYKKKGELDKAIAAIGFAGQAADLDARA